MEYDHHLQLLYRRWNHLCERVKECVIFDKSLAVRIMELAQVSLTCSHPFESLNHESIYTPCPTSTPCLPCFWVFERPTTSKQHSSSAQRFYKWLHGLLGRIYARRTSFTAAVSGHMIAIATSSTVTIFDFGPTVKWRTIFNIS